MADRLSCAECGETHTKAFVPWKCIVSYSEKQKALAITPREEAEALALTLLERPAFERIVFLQRLREMMELAGRIPTLPAADTCVP